MEAKKGIDFAAIPQTALKVLTSPVTFFREMPKTGGFIAPLVFVVVLAVVTAIVDGVLGVLGLKFFFSVWAALFSIIITPIVAAVVGFIIAAIVFIIWKLMGSQESYETAYRCVAYTAALMPIVTITNVVPYIGMLITAALWIYFYVTASIEAHKIEAQKAWIVFGLIGAVLFLIGLGAEIGSKSARQQLLEMQKQMQKQ